MAVKKKNPLPKKNKKKSKIKFGFVFFGSLIFITVLLVISAWWLMWKNNIKKIPAYGFVYIKTGSNFSDVENELKPFVHNAFTFQQLSNWMSYTENVKPGRYRLRENMNNVDLIRLLRSGAQEPVRCRIKSVNLRQDIMGFFAGQLEADMEELDSLIHSQSWCKSQGMDTANIISWFIPDTYFFNWNTDAQGILMRMKEVYQKFWDKEKIEKASRLGLKPVEIITLASIISGETNQVSEMPTIAGVFLNRLNKGIALEADPTIEFAWGDFGIRRVLKRHLTIESPYNTYLHTGLPPGPICNPDVKAILAMLSPEKHSYFFYCADLDRPGFHAFSKDYATHLMYARKYQQRRFSKH